MTPPALLLAAIMQTLLSTMLRAPRTALHALSATLVLGLAALPCVSAAADPRGADLTTDAGVVLDVPAAGGIELGDAIEAVQGQVVRVDPPAGTFLLDLGGWQQRVHLAQGQLPALGTRVVAVGETPLGDTLEASTVVTP